MSDVSEVALIMLRQSQKSSIVVFCMFVSMVKLHKLCYCKH